MYVHMYIYKSTEYSARQTHYIVFVCLFALFWVLLSSFSMYFSTFTVPFKSLWYWWINVCVTFSFGLNNSNDINIQYIHTFCGIKCWILPLFLVDGKQAIKCRTHFMHFCILRHSKLSKSIHWKSCVRGIESRV